MFVTLRKANDDLLISSKRIVLKNDYIRQVLDIYHV
jgi:benzoate/toluate 1,2-dioxygenase beta subunit